MNILILANKPPYPPKDGSSLATLNMAMGLANSGNKITLVAITTPKHFCSIEQIPTNIKELIDFNLVFINTRINPIKGILNLLFSNKPYNIERFISKDFSHKVAEIINQNKFDIIQIEGLYLSPYIRLIKEITKTPVVYRSHNIEHEIWLRISKNEKNWLRAKYYLLLSKRIRKMETEISDQVDALVAISKRDEHWLKLNGFYKDSISIPLGYVNPESKGITGLENDNLCFLGSLDWIPNQEGLNWFLDEVWPKIKKELPSISFHIAGRNTPVLIKEKLKKDEKIRFHGEVESSMSYLNNYSILVVPILSGSGMRVKIVEGMMLGKVIVTTTIGIEGIDITNHEHAIIADTPGDFSKAIVELIRQPAYKVRIAEKARTFAMSHFNNSMLTKELEEFYKKLTK